MNFELQIAQFPPMRFKIEVTLKRKINMVEHKEHNLLNKLLVRKTAVRNSTVVRTGVTGFVKSKYYEFYHFN